MNTSIDIPSQLIILRSRQSSTSEGLEISSPHFHAHGRAGWHVPDTLWPNPALAGPARLSAMTGYHCRCEDIECVRRCRRPGCLEPQVHFLSTGRYENKRRVAYHDYDCRVPFRGFAVINAARQAIEELNPNMGPSEVGIARRVIGKMLDRLEQLEHTVVTVVDPPLLLPAAKEHKRPHVVAAPRELTRAQAQHLQWLAERKERTA